MKEGFVKAKRIESGNFPKSSFSGTLKEAYFTQKENGAIVLKLDFLDGKTYDMLAIVVSEKPNTKGQEYGVHEDGTYDDFLPVGQWLKSVESLDAVTGLPNPDANVKHVSIGFAFMDGLPTGIDFEPELRGRILYNVATPKTVGTPDQTSKYPDWTISQVDGLSSAAPVSAPARKPGKLSAEPQQQQTETQTAVDLSDIVLAALDVKVLKSIKDVFKFYEKKYDFKNLRTAFETLLADGFIVQEGDRYRKL